MTLDVGARKSRFISAWSAFDAIGRQTVQIGGAVVLARILTPTEFGQFILPAAIYAAIAIVSDLGQSASLIQRKRPGRLLYSSVFWLHLVTAGFLSAVTFVSYIVMAPEDWKHVLGVCAVLSLSVIFNALGLVPGVVLMKSLDFRRLTIINLCSSVAGVSTGIWVAVAIGGPVAFAAQLLGTNVCAAGALLMISKFRPKMRFSLNSLISIRATSALSLITNGMHAIQSSSYIWAMAPVVSAQTMGVFGRAEGLRQMILTVFDAAFSRTSLPRFVNHADDPARLVQLAGTTLKVSALFLAPVALGLAAMATPFTIVIFGEQWTPMAGYLTILAVAASILPFHVLTWNMLLALKKTRICFVIQICRTLLVLTTVVIAARFGAMATAWGILAISVMATALYAPLTKSLLGYGLLAQFAATWTIYLSAIVMALIVRFVATHWGVSPALLFITLPIIGAVTYVICLAIFGERWPFDMDGGERYRSPAAGVI